MNAGTTLGAVPAPPSESVTSSSLSVSASGIAGSASAAVVNPAGESGGPRSSVPAKQVATILSAGRAGEVESSRAMTSSSATNDPRQSHADRNPSENPPAGRKSEAGVTERQSDGNDAKLGDARKTAFDQLVRSIRLQLGSRHSSARLQLEPPELGRLHVLVRVDGERLRVDVRTETAAARDLVSTRAVQLTAALERQGISVERFEVTAESLAEHRPDWADGDDSTSDLTTSQEGGQQRGRSSSRANQAALADRRPSPLNEVEQDWHSRPEWEAIIAPARLDIRV
jgi:flagellar hook-length control protein FliK